MDIHLLAPNDLEKPHSSVLRIKWTRQARRLIFKGKVLNNPSYRPNEPLARDDEIENFEPEPRIFRKTKMIFFYSRNATQVVQYIGPSLAGDRVVA